MIKSLTYFEDANEDLGPVMFGKLEWDTVKEKILNEVRQYLKR